MLSDYCIIHAKLLDDQANSCLEQLKNQIGDFKKFQDILKKSPYL